MNARAVARLALAMFFIAAGLNHFFVPALYLAIMPPFLPWPAQLVAISGVAEILGGAGVLNARTRNVAAIGLIALLIAVFPANVEAVRVGMSVNGYGLPAWVLWTRLPLQAFLIWWVYRCSLRHDSRPSS